MGIVRARIPLAAGVLYPLSGLLAPVVAAAPMALSSVSVIAHALRLRMLEVQVTSREGVAAVA